MMDLLSQFDCAGLLCWCSHWWCHRRCHRTSPCGSPCWDCRWGGWHEVSELGLPWFGCGFEPPPLQVFQTQALPLFPLFLGLALVMGCAPVPLPTVSRALFPGCKLSFFSFFSLFCFLTADCCPHMAVPIFATLSSFFIQVAVRSRAEGQVMSFTLALVCSWALPLAPHRGAEFLLIRFFCGRGPLWHKFAGCSH